MNASGTGLVLHTERVTLDPQKPTLYLVPHSALRALYCDLGSLYRLSLRGWDILQRSCGNKLPVFPHGIAAPVATVAPSSLERSSPGLGLVAWRVQISRAVDPAYSYAVKAESSELQGRLIELAQSSATEAIIARISATTPDWRTLVGREIRKWARQHAAFVRQSLAEILAEGALDPLGKLGQIPGSPASEAPATFSSETITRLFLDRLNLPEILASYKIVQFLGIGPITASFLAEHVNAIDSPGVVLKILRPSLDQIPDWFVRSLMERLRQLQRFPGVLLSDDLLADQDRRIILERYMRGGNLADVVADLMGSERLLMILRALSDICEALVSAHRRQLAHGGVSARNVLSDGQRFRLADFLSAHLARSAGGATPALEFSEAVRKKDIHDLGAMLKLLAAEQLAPEWLTELIGRCTDESPLAPLSAEEILREYVIPFVTPFQERPVVLSIGRAYRSDRIHYDLDLGGQRSIEMLSHSAGDAYLRALRSLWDGLGDVWVDGERLRVATPERIAKTAEILGESASEMILGPLLYSRLAESLPAPLWLIYEPEVAAIPWELLTVNGRPLCQWVPMARSPRLWSDPGLPAPAGARPQTRSLASVQEKIRVLLIADPTGTLPFARRECNKIHLALQSGCFADRFSVSTVDDSTEFAELCKKMRISDVIHFAGHAIFSEENPADSALILKRDYRLNTLALRSFWNPKTAPLLFFASSCSSAMVPPENHAAYLLSNATMGLAQAFLTAGVGSYVGTLWKIPDDPTTEHFAVAFYRRFFAGYSAGRAMMAARNESSKQNGLDDLTWARYTLYGHPLNRIELLQRSAS
jgi:hypothetical protein